MKTSALKAAISIALAAVAALAMLAGCSGAGGGAGAKGSTGVDTFTFENVLNIDAVLDIADVTLKPGDGFSVTVDRKNYPELIVSEDGGLLTIAEPSNVGEPSADASVSIEITVPGTASLSAYHLMSDTGDVEARGVSAPAIDLRSDTGAVKLSGVESSTVNLNSDTGDIELSDFEGMADAALYLSADTGKIVVDGEEYEGQYNRVPELPAAADAEDESAAEGAARGNAATDGEADATGDAAAAADVEDDLDAVEPGNVTGATIVAHVDTGTITVK